MKMKKSEIMKIIKEEIQYMKAELNESSRSTSALEIEELLRVFAKNAGGLPEDIHRLSVLFPVLERSGLGELVEEYREVFSTKGPDAAKTVLEDVKTALIKIRQEQ